MTEPANERAADADASALPAIESIKRLKARYCRYLDTKDWAAWRTIFADDFVAFTRKALRGQPTAHQVHAPEIQLTSATTARGIWALQDVVRFEPGVTLVGYGHYHETYENVAGQDRGWSFTGWYDTTEAQALLDFQEHDWHQTVAWVAETPGPQRILVRALSPLLRPVLLVQRRPTDGADTPIRGR